MQQIGIAITTRNREATAKETITKIRKYAPKGAKIVIVDDASDKPFEGADFRFENQAGIARAKNKCFELLNDCEHLFLFDDDCWPKVKDWHLPYVNSKHNHLMYIFGNFSNGKPNGNRKEKEIEDAVIYENPCGCMIYYKRVCLDKVGGMDPAYGIWGFEHPDHSVRIHNAGLTPYKFMDIKSSDDLFFSHDKEQTVERSVPTKIRMQHIAKNKRKFESLGKSAHLIPYLPENNLILTCYFTSLVDPQRGEKWEFNEHAIDELYNSMPNGINFKCLMDHGNMLSGGNIERSSPKNDNPYLAKWIAFRDYLISHPEVDNVFLLDGTDVEVLNDPFPHIKKDKLYVGDEPGALNNVWLMRHHNSADFKRFYITHKNAPLLNAGICGGSKGIVLAFLNKLCENIERMNCGLTDMAVYNYTLYLFFGGSIVHGRQVNTVFKAFDKVNKEGSFFRHK